MPHKINFLHSPPLRPVGGEFASYDGTVDFSKFAVGDMAFYHHRGVACCNHSHLQTLHLTAFYFANNFKRRAPVILALPDKAFAGGKIFFLVDGQCYSSQCTKCSKSRRKCKCGEAYMPRGYYDGWSVIGEPPTITVSPSVNYDDDEGGIKHYHGFIQNGVIGEG